MKSAERHRLKHDLYADTVWAASRWIREHLLQVLLGAAAALAVAAAVVWVTLERQRAAGEASEALTEIVNDARGVPALDGEKRRELVGQLTGRCEALAMDYPHSDAAPSALMLAGAAS